MTPKQLKPSPANKISSKNPTIRDYLIANLYWIAPLTIATIVAVVTTYYQFHQVVEADLTVTNLSIESDTPNQRVYAINFLINNSGNQAINIKNSAPFIRHISDTNQPIKLLTASSNPETFKDSLVKAGEIKSFLAHAYIDKSFISAGINDQKFFSKQITNLPQGKILAVSMEVELGIRIYGGDRKERVAISPHLA